MQACFRSFYRKDTFANVAVHQLSLKIKFTINRNYAINNIPWNTLFFLNKKKFESILWKKYYSFFHFSNHETSLRDCWEFKKYTHFNKFLLFYFWYYPFIILFKHKISSLKHLFVVNATFKVRETFLNMETVFLWNHFLRTIDSWEMKNIGCNLHCDKHWIFFFYQCQ